MATLLPLRFNRAAPVSSPDQKAVDEWRQRAGLPECFDQEWNELDANLLHGRVGWWRYLWLQTKSRSDLPFPVLLVFWTDWMSVQNTVVSSLNSAFQTAQ